MRAAGARLDDREYGAALLVGLNGLVMVGHGRGKRDRVYFALKGTAKLVEADVLDRIRAEIASTTERG